MLDDGLLLLLDDLLNGGCLRDLDLLQLGLLRLRRRRRIDRVGQRNDLRGSVGLRLDVGHDLGLVVAQGTYEDLLAVEVGQLQLAAGQLLGQALALTELGRLGLDLDLLRLRDNGLLYLDLDLLRLLMLRLRRCHNLLDLLLNLLNLLVLLDLDRLIADDLLTAAMVQNDPLTTDHDLLAG